MYKLLCSRTIIALGWEMVQWAKYSPRKHEDQSSNPVTNKQTNIPALLWEDGRWRRENSQKPEPASLAYATANSGQPAPNRVEGKG